MAKGKKKDWKSSYMARQVLKMDSFVYLEIYNVRFFFLPYHSRSTANGMKLSLLGEEKEF